jgi:hypothetical protein
MTQHKVSDQGTPAAPQTPATEAGQPPPAAEPAVNQTELQLEPAKPPPWLAPRLQEAKGTGANEILRLAGVNKAEELTAKLTRLAELEQATLTAEERATRELADLRTRAAEADRYKQMSAALAEQQFASLPENERAAIEDLSPIDRIPYITRFAKARSGAQGIVDPALAIPAPAPAPAPKPAETAPPGKAPARSGTSTKYDEWQAMPDSTIKSLFYGANTFEIERSRPAQS